MATTILAAVAALCALAAICSGVPILSEAPQLSEHQQLTADAAISGISPTDSPEVVTREMQGLLDEIQQTLDDTEAAVKNASQAVDTDALQLTNELNARMQEWVDKANQSLVDVSACVNGQSGNLVNVVKNNFTVDARKCLDGAVKALESSLQTLRDLVLQGNANLQKYATEDEKCVKKYGDRPSFCRLRALLNFTGRISRLDQTISLRVPEITNTVNTLLVSNKACISSAFQTALGQGTGIVDASISCIKDKLSPPSQLN